jgi:hypothetical protein
MINMSHPLVKVANEIDWTRFDAAWGKFYHEKKGRPGLPTRLMAGLHLLKHLQIGVPQAFSIHCSTWAWPFRHACGPCSPGPHRPARR